MSDDARFYWIFGGALFSLAITRIIIDLANWYLWLALPFYFQPTF